MRLWVASTDYSGDLNIDDKILARVVDAYRRIRNTLRFLLANVSDFDPALDTVPADQLLEIDGYALARAAQLQAEILRHYDVYEFHPVSSPAAPARRVSRSPCRPESCCATSRSAA